MTRHTSSLALAALLALITGCSDYGGALDPYADMDAGVDMPQTTAPDVPADLAIDPVDQGMDAPDLTQPVPDMPVIMELPVPKELQAVAESTGVTLTWLPARGAIRYEVRINGGPWKSTGSEMQFVHEDAPGGTVTSATITASDMTERPHVALNAQDIIGEPGPEQIYEVRAIHEDGASTPSEPTTAQRPFEVDTITWERQDEGRTDWQPLPAATGNATLDATAAPEGDTHTYRALITPIASDTFTSTSDPGARLAATQVSGGFVHFCALLNDGSVKCWGDNRGGQLGLGHKDTILQDTNAYPLRNALLPEKIQQISSGSGSLCALSISNKIYCWGTLFETQEYEYEERNGQKTVKELAAQNDVLRLPKNYTGHMCYITLNNTLKCYGRNAQGQLGYGDTVNRLAPTSEEIDLGQDVLSVQHSISGTCALLQDSTVACWGIHGFVNGGLAIGDEPNEMPPTPFTTGSAADQLSLNALFNGCVGSSLSTQCWGDGEYGKLGSEDVINQQAPGNFILMRPEVSLIEQRTHVSVGISSTCIRTDIGNVYCWGKGTTGVNGNESAENIGDNEGDILTAVKLGGQATNVDIQGEAACSIVSGEVLCWGNNVAGQMGRFDIALGVIIGDEPGEMPPQPVQLW